MYTVRKGGGMSQVIHVDNSQFFRKIMKAYLAELGFESGSYDSGCEALSAVRAGGDVSCVITGLEFHDMKGEDFISSLVALDKPLSIIVFSSNTDEYRNNYLESLGVLGIVQKTSNWKEELRKFFN